MESKASEKAVEAGREWNPSPYKDDHRKAIDAAHDPSLGLDRSVCLRDVVVALRGQARQAVLISDQLAEQLKISADAIEREFT